MEWIQKARLSYIYNTHNVYIGTSW